MGAGGLSNALPELVHDSGRGAVFELRKIPNDEPGMSPKEIWCNEAQERYVLAVATDALGRFAELCSRERCPFAVLGQATADGRLVLTDSHFGDRPIDMPLALLLGKPPKMLRRAERVRAARTPFPTADLDLREAILRVLRLPSVADKTFLITIGDRTVTGLVCRDQMVGPWQVPVADAAVTTTGYHGYTGEAMAMGERTPLALLNAAASARMAVGEALTNLASAPIAQIGDVKLSANWMAAAGHPGEDARLYEAVHAVGCELAPALGIAIPVGKDSMSMSTVWHEAGQEKRVTAPLSLIVSAFAPVTDVRRALTPQLRLDQGDTELLLVDLGMGHHRLGGSALAQVYGQIGDEAPDLDDPAVLKTFFATIQQLNRDGLLLAYHDRSDGGLFVTLLEMAFAGGCGLAIDLAGLACAAPALLFSEELGAVIQVRKRDAAAVRAAFAGSAGHIHVVGHPRAGQDIVFRRGDHTLIEETRANLRRVWSETTFAMQTLRDDPTCAREEHEARCDENDPGISLRLTFDLNQDVAAPLVGRGAKPRVAILREQGVNGQVEMAAAFHRAGFEAVDVHMSDILSGRMDLDSFRGLAACGGFSYGDVLGAGEGWAKSILFHARARAAFERFFARPDTFTLGVCNGCQAVSNLKEIIPGAQDWPRFVRNRSEQFEARLALLRIEESPSVLLRGMAGSQLPIAVAHGEGRAEFESDAAAGQSGEGRPGGRTLREPLRCDRQPLPGQPQRLARRHDRADHPRWPRHHPDAAPRAHVSGGPAFLASRRLGRRRPLDALVPQRTGFRRLAILRYHGAHAGDDCMDAMGRCRGSSRPGGQTARTGRQGNGRGRAGTQPGLGPGELARPRACNRALTAAAWRPPPRTSAPKIPRSAPTPHSTPAFPSSASRTSSASPWPVSVRSRCLQLAGAKPKAGAPTPATQPAASARPPS